VSSAEKIVATAVIDASLADRAPDEADQDDATRTEPAS
jgi:hypothetical protein